MSLDRVIPIAIVGLSAELPSGLTSTSNLDYKEFIQFLLNGQTSYEKIPKERFDIDLWKGKQLGRILTERGSFLKNIDAFDHVEFGIAPKDAKAMPVSARKLLELSFLALLDSGIDYRTRNIGCFMSGINFETLQLSDIDEYEARGSFAGIPAQMANRISYHLDLLGPSVPTDTACSSSLTAMHLAVQAIRNGECEAAVVGGAQINQRLLDFVQYSQSGVLAPDGICKPFDAEADGFSRGEGAVVVVVKPLEQALKDNDKIYGTILGTGINSTGCAAPAYAPVAAAQEDSMHRAYQMAQRNFKDVDFVELHATGTAQGDPTEANWVGRIFQREDQLLVGSVKGNIGHLEIISFLAALCKVCGMFETGIIPPNANLQTLNPAIKWDEYHLRVPLEKTSLTARSASRRPLISISSSGIGGSTGHCVVEGPPKLRPRPNVCRTSDAPVLLVAGALSPRSTVAMSQAIVELAKQHTESLDSISTVYGRRARQMTWRSFAVVNPHDMSKIRFSQPSLSPRSKAPVGFIFSGQGPQHLKMGCQLFEAFPTFRNTILELDAVYQKVVGESLIQTTGLFDTRAKATSSLPEVWPIDIILPSICMVQIAMFDLLASLGIRPDFVVGHSAGETALLYASGAAEKSMAMEIAIHRGHSLALTEAAGGTMAALSCGLNTAKELISKLDVCSDVVLDIACLNSDESVTAAGHGPQIDQLVELCKSEGIAAQRLRTNVGVHSGLMELCKEDYCSRMENVFHQYPLRSPSVQVYSTVTGQLFSEEFSAKYFWDNTRNPVRFSEALRSAQRDYQGKTPVFVEIGAHPVLSAYLSAVVPEAIVISTMRRTKQMTEHFERTIFLQAVGSFVAAGYNTVDFMKLNAGASHELSLPLPPYPFSKKIVPSMSPYLGQDKVLARNGPLNGPRLRINSQTHPDLAEHVMKGEPILPATGFVEMALEFGARTLWDVNFHSFLSLSSEEPTPVFVRTDGMRWSVKTPGPGYHEVVCRGGDLSKAERLHADGYMSNESVSHPAHVLSISDIRARCEQVNVEGFYSDLRYFAEYGPCFQMVKSCYRSETEFLVEVDTRRPRTTPSYDYCIDPAVLDACIHVMVHPLLTGNADKNVYYLPSGFRRFFFYDAARDIMTDTLYAYGSNARWTPESLTYDVVVMDSNGQFICEFRQFTVTMHALQPDLSVHYDMKAEQCGVIPVSDLELTPNCANLPHKGCLVQDDTIIFAYLRGREYVLQDALRNIDLGMQKTIWIFAKADRDGGAALGFSRSLRRELLSSTVRVVVHQMPLSMNDIKVIVSSLGTKELQENELLLHSDGGVYVHRLRPETSDLDSLGDHQLAPQQNVQNSGPAKVSSGQLHVRVDFIQRDASTSNVWGFVGHLQTGEAVAGVWHGAVAEELEISATLVVLLKNMEMASMVAGGIVTSVVGRLGLDELPALHPTTGRYTALITHTDNHFGASLVSFFQSKGFSVTTLGSDATVASLLNIDLSLPFDIVLSGYTDTRLIKVLTTLTKDPRSTILWNHQTSGIEALIKHSPIRLSHLLVAAVEGLDLQPTCDYGCSINSLKPFLTASIPTYLFHPEKVYILFGGVGSLGLRIACWMYSEGARHIVVTSRSGRQTLLRSKNYPALRVLNYLEQLRDLNITIESSDAASLGDLKSLSSRLERPVGGCMLLTAVLEDQPFTPTTPSYESFSRVFASKTGVFDAVRRAIDITALDFVICFTSISGLFGSAGQTNYAAANTTLEVATRNYDNAFCFVAPAVLDTAIVFGDAKNKTTHNTKVRHITEWGMSTHDICQYLGDGIRKMKRKSFWLYIPPFNFNLVKENLGASDLFAHLVTEEASSVSGLTGKATTDVTPKDIILKVLDIDEEDFEAKVPLVAYGLDSLLASKLSVLLRRWTPITQLQLLADLSFDDIMSRIESSAAANANTTEAGSQGTDDKDFFDWEEVMRNGPTVVKLSEGTGTPLFVLHGPAGTIEAFDSMRREFKTPLYGVQATKDAPYHSLPELTEFYYKHILEVQSSGPYRIAGFCGSSLLVFMLADVFQKNGHQIVQASLIDHFPMLYVSPIWELDEETAISGKISDMLQRKGLDWIASLYRIETSPSEKKAGEELMRAGTHPESVRPHVAKLFKNTTMFINAHAHYLLTTFTDSSKRFDRQDVYSNLVKWLGKFDFPVTLYMAKSGMRNLFAEQEQDEWGTLGSKACLFVTDVKVIQASHFDILSNKQFITSLEKDWGTVQMAR
ncbi:Mycolipanoate synthase [Stygiomarasmius scandens]|uniref:Mycolipanoate synthase n=1 Tax=Marasmiellus scandens TaxID=2682957 RepID=A0ABR1J6X7_9AGAR